jgi:hypothetical protein
MPSPVPCEYEIGTTMRYAEVASWPMAVRTGRRVQIRLVRVGDEWVYADFEIDAATNEERSP